MPTTTRIRPFAGAVIPLLAAILLAFMLPAAAAPKKSSTGESCTSSGTERRDGKDAATGETFNCLFDYCTYCSTTNGQIDCSRLVTEYTNGRDCKAARAGLKGRPELAQPGGAVLDPGRRTPKPFTVAPRTGTLKAN
jgi:hypothetical protein